MLKSVDMQPHYRYLSHLTDVLGTRSFPEMTHACAI